MCVPLPAVPDEPKVESTDRRVDRLDVAVHRGQEVPRRLVGHVATDGQEEGEHAPVAPVDSLRTMLELPCTTETTNWADAPAPAWNRLVGLSPDGSTDHSTVPVGENLSIFCP